MTDFEGLLAAVVRGGAELILVGGVAARVHGAARLTQCYEALLPHSITLREERDRRV